MRKAYYVAMNNIETGEVDHYVGPMYGIRSAEQVKAGASINLDHDRYFLSIEEFDEVESTDVVENMRCPHCNAENSVEFLEDVLAVRQVMGKNSDGEIIIEGEYKVYDEGAENARFLCKTCGRIDLVNPEETTIHFS